MPESRIAEFRNGYSTLVVRKTAASFEIEGPMPCSQFGFS
jgi:hypothetical protein